MDFHDKVVLITGATGGIGEALAKQLTTEHTKLALLARREDQLTTIAHHITTNHGTCITKTCDVSKPQDVKDAITYTQQHYGTIDIAILTAGILIPNPIDTFNSKTIIDTMTTNFFGDIYCIEHLLPIMKQQHHGAIAAISTLPDRRGIPGWSAYGASKAAISWLMESLRAEAKQKYNIDIITIKPGSVQTPMIKDYHRQGAITPEHAATAIITAMKHNHKIIQFPLSQTLMIRLEDLFPPFAYDRIPIPLLKGDGYPEPPQQH